MDQHTGTRTRNRNTGAPHFQLELTHVHCRPACPKLYTVAQLRQRRESTVIRDFHHCTSPWLQIGCMAILKIYPGHVVGWMLARHENEHSTERFICETVVKQGIVRDQLTIHSDRGSSMRSQTVAQLLATLGITKPHSRPHVSDANPFSESLFKTLKCRPEFPGGFSHPLLHASLSGACVILGSVA
jgi:transposase InsO family protein